MVNAELAQLYSEPRIAFVSNLHGARYVRLPTNIFDYELLPLTVAAAGRCYRVLRSNRCTKMNFSSVATLAETVSKFRPAAHLSNATKIAGSPSVRAKKETA
jgi:hypothetical protein